MCSINELVVPVVPHPYHKDPITIKYHMGGCQSYGPFLDPYYSTALNI